MKLLIAEDDLMMADLLEDLLASAGFEVCGIARTVTKAVEIARQHRPNIAIVDVTLADGEPGTCLANRLGADWPFGILFASGGSGSEQLLGCGGTAVIGKPYQPADLLEAIRIVGEIVEAGRSDRRLPQTLELLRPPAPIKAHPLASP